jgi:hypothetical protein
MEKVNSIDKITMDVPLFIRMLEYAKEDAKTDMDLHSATEKVIKLCKKGGTLSMKNYNSIVSEKVEASEQTTSGSSGGFEAPAFGGEPIKRKINKIHNMNEMEGIDPGQYDAPFGDLKKNPLKINGVKSIKQSRAVKDKKFPKWGGPGGVFVKVKEKCKKFPYCNQGDTKALEFYEIEGMSDVIEETSKKYGLSVKDVEKIVLNEIKQIFI